MALVPDIIRQRFQYSQPPDDGVVTRDLCGRRVERAELSLYHADDHFDSHFDLHAGVYRMARSTREVVEDRQ